MAIKDMAEGGIDSLPEEATLEDILEDACRIHLSFLF